MDCVWSAWSNWSFNCSQHCGTDDKISKRYIEQSAEYGGKECNGETERHEGCDKNDLCKGKGIPIII